MATGNVTYEQSVGLMTAMTEITRNGAKSARGLVSIQSRYNQIIDESSSTGKKLTQWYKDHNITIKDQNGQLRSFYEVGKDVADIWDTLSDNERKYYLNTQAGANQSQNLAALMRNYQTAIDATATALDSAGSAAQENARYMGSMEGKLGNLKSEWEDFSRKMVNSDALKNAIDGLTKFVHFLTTDFGQSLVKAGVGLVAFGGAFKLFKGLASLVIAPLKSANRAFGLFGKTAGKTAKPLGKVGKGMKVVKAPTIGAAKAAGKAATGFTLLGGSFSGLASILTSPAGLIASMLALGAGIMYVNTEINKAKSPEKQYENTHKKLGELESKYDEVTDAIDRLHKKQEKGGLTPAESSQLAYLEQEKSQVEDLIETYRELEKAQKTQSSRTPDSKVNKTDKVKQHMRPVTKASPLGAVTKQAQKDAGAYDLLSSKVQIYGDKVVQAGKKQSEMNNLLSKAKDAEASGEYDKAQKYLDKYQEKADEAKKAQKDINKAFKDMKETNDELKEFYGSQDRMPDDIRESSKAVDKMVKSYDSLVKLNKKGGKKGVDFMGLSGGALDKTITDFKTLGDTIGITVDESGKLNGVNFDTFSASLDSMGYTTEEINSALQMLGEQHPEATFEIEGVEVAGKDVDTVLEYLDEADGKDAEATVEINGSEVAVSDITDVNDLADRLNGKKFKSTIDVKGGKKAQKEVGEVTDDLKTAGKTKAKPEIKVKGGEKAKDETTQVEESMDELDGKDADVEVNETGATQATGEVHGLMGVISALFGKNVPVTQTGATEASGQVGGLESKIAGLSGNTVAVQEQGAAPSAGRVGALNSIIGKLQSRTVQETARTSGTGSVSSLVTYQNALHDKSVTYTVTTVHNNEAHGTKNAPEGLAQVNEYGYEYIRDAKTGLLRVANKGRRGYTVLSQGDIVYTHGESMRMKQAKEEELPKYAKGKKGKNKEKAKKANKAYKKHVEKIRTQYDNAVDLAEHKQEMEHWSDAQVANAMQKAWKKYTDKLKKYNKSKKVKKWKKKKYIKLINSLGKQRRWDKQEATEGADYDERQEALELEIENLGLGFGRNRGAYSDRGESERHLEWSEVEAQRQRLQGLRDKHKISAEDYKKYMDDIYHAYADSQMKMYETDKLTAEEMKKILEEQVQEGRITWKEYYDYIDDIDEREHDKLTKRLDKQIENLGLGFENAKGNANTGKEFRYLEWNEVVEQREELKKLRDDGKITADEFEDYMDSIYHSYADSQMEMYEKGKITSKAMLDTLQSLVQEGRITWKEYYDYVNTIEEKQHDERIKRLEKEIENLGIGSGKNAGVQSNKGAYERYLEQSEVDAQRKSLSGLLKQGEITKEEFEGYMDTIYHKYIESQMKMYEDGSRTAKWMQDTLSNYVHAGLLTWAEYYDYIDQITEKEKSKKIEAIEKEISAYTLRNKTLESSINVIKNLAKAGGLTSQEEQEYIKQLKQKYLDQYYTLYTNGKKTYKEMLSLIQTYYKEGILNAEKYYNKLDELNEQQLNRERERIQKMQTQADNENSLAQSWLKLKIEALEKENELIDKQNDLLELQNDLEKAKSKRVRVYREGIGFVYERDTEAIKEATNALKEYEKQQESPELTALKEVLALFEDKGALANIKNLENLTGLTADTYFSKMGTDLDKWAKWISDNLAKSNGIALLLDTLGNVTDPNDILKLLDANGSISNSLISQYINKSKFASGSLSTPAGFARVGEQGYEIALLGNGDAIMPHNVSQNLMSWGQYNPNDLVNNIGNAVYSYQFDKLVLPNVVNAEDFMRELKQLPNKAIQSSMSRTM